MALADVVGILLGVSGLVVAGAAFFFRADAVVEELAREHDEMRRFRNPLPDGWLVLLFRAFGGILVLIGVTFGYAVVRPSAPISSVASTGLVFGVLVFVGASAVAMILRPRAFIVGMNPTLELLDSYISDEMTEKLIRAFAFFVLLSSLLFLYFLFVL